MGVNFSTYYCIVSYFLLEISNIVIEMLQTVLFVFVSINLVVERKIMYRKLGIKIFE